MAPEAPTFFLTNGADRPPIVHSVFAPSTGTWQYTHGTPDIVACPSTLHCLILDPVRDHLADRAAISTTAANKLIALIRKHGYTCDIILETNASPTTTQTAAWFLRMQLSDIQGWAPEVCRDATAVATVESMWQRKYGTASPFASKLRASPQDGENITVGRMRVQVMSVPSLGSPNQRAYRIGNTLFGAYGLAALSREDWSATGSITEPDAASDVGVHRDTCTDVWTAMQRVLSLPEDTRVYYHRGEVNVMENEEPYKDVRHCTDINQYVDLGSSEFFTRRQGEYQEHWLEQQRQKSSRRRRGRRVNA
ncbi:hypothetical protein LTR56_010296 [Elasticomyces elasticus]|nr:hypothetical protein LTR56_010296 [Elasticomyces elasticus]KAK3658267.1 hypothetical protein LTR22_008968 [Elasticomyces elasticus]KAK4922973.1 hypothetical protein LTR49_009804 [Elasticomyces elasticus]KAK5747707.1 hypothetical protein LTS12_022256 [Elasticomyces elasticus]